jgi:hypothetical protein
MLKNKTNDQKELLNVHKLDIKNQEEKTEVQQQNADRADLAEKALTEECDKLDTGIGGVDSLKSAIRNNNKLFEKKRTALKNHQLLVETEVIAALDRKVATMEKEKERAKDGHEKLKKERTLKEIEMKEKQASLEKQIKAHLKSMRDDCETTQAHFEQCLDMIDKRTEYVSVPCVEVSKCSTDLLPLSLYPPSGTCS